MFSSLPQETQNKLIEIYKTTFGVNNIKIDNKDIINDLECILSHKDIKKVISCYEQKLINKKGNNDEEENNNNEEENNENDGVIDSDDEWSD